MATEAGGSPDHLQPAPQGGAGVRWWRRGRRAGVPQLHACNL